MSLTQEAIQHIQETAIQPDNRHIFVEGRDFIINEHGEANEIGRESTETFATNTLSSIVAYIKDLDYKADKLYLQIKSEREVVLKSTLQDDNSRDQLIHAKAIVPDQHFKRFMDVEELNIELQSKFKESDDRDIILSFIGNVNDEEVHNYSDDGISQSMTIRQGVASVGEVKVPNPVTLTPFSTFQEVNQPERLFIFRMRDGARGALFDTDDNTWKLKAINSIKEYFEWELADVKQDVVILA